MPNDLEGLEACFSLGVGNVSGFEKDCTNLGIKVFCADDSVEELPEKFENVYFVKKHIGASSNMNFITLDDFVKNSLSNLESDLILQMDIEGFEYETILSTSNSLMSRFRVIVIEFHALHWLWSLQFFNLASRVFEKILETHSVVHIHPNNDGFILKNNGIEIHSCLEFTFLRNDRINNKYYTNNFPHKLDWDNTPKAPQPLSNYWYKK